ncbi:MAG: hypothetical protein QOF30_3198 [Acidimicrobiaceae bacterium]|jgi:hypothetical protein|nr:hypothetical protein [Acidimicrobiaceae bacterium]
MVKRQLVTFSYTCDVCGDAIPDSDGERATRTVSWEGASYSVDVCATHSSQLSDLLTDLQKFVDAGSRVSGGRGRRPGALSASGSKGPRGRRPSASSPASGAAKRTDLGAVRSWARANGHKVNERGRIPGDVLVAYDAANGGAAGEPAPEAPQPNGPAAAAATGATRSPRGRRSATSTSKSGTAPKRGDLGAVRAWARENGLQVSERGRIPGTLLAAYDEANNGAEPSAAAPATPAPRKRRPRKSAATAG